MFSHFNSPRLRNWDLEKENIFDAYEYPSEEFAEQTKKRGDEFFTPREVVRLLVNFGWAKRRHEHLRSYHWFWWYAY
ncbi:MAG: N-6 DNA methylase [Nitrososphaeraceae archaeon]|nr:N-6 DNA methylase [Nitrososphaeraceae archaeon]